jgi:hypothetical protein
MSNFNSIRLLPNYDHTTLTRKVAAKGEVFYDPDTVSLRVFDGAVSGGYTLLRADLNNVSGTLPAANLAGNIPNSKLANPTITLGTTAASLGATVTDIAGLNSIAATTFTGNLSGTASSVTNGVYTTGPQTIGGAKTFSTTIVGNISGNAGTASKLQTSITINNQPFDGSTSVIIPADAMMLTNDTIAANVIHSSLQDVGTLTSLSVAGAITVPTTPVAKTDATNKNYVDIRAVAMSVALS